MTASSVSAAPQRLVATALCSPTDHARVLHEGGRGRVTIAQMSPGQRRWRERSVAVADLAAVLSDFAGRADCYLTQNRFWTRRRIADLAELDALFADLDYYKTEFADRTPGFMLEAALQALDDADRPSPSFAVASGRGLALVWLHEPVPRHALPRWRLCQQRIFEVLRSFGADPMATDAARMLRLIGTRNSKSGTLVEEISPAGPTWDFDVLANEILPYTRAEIVALRVEAARRRAERSQHNRHVAPSRFTAATLWEGRLTELQALLRHRWFGALPPGHRHDWLLIAGAAVSYLVPSPVLHRELCHLACHATAGAWSESETKRGLHGIIPRAEAYARGETIQWRGRQRDPRFHFRTDTIIRWLEITESEMRTLKFRHLVTPEIRRDHERARMSQLRRAQGAISREDYRAGAHARQIQAAELRSRGLTWEAVGNVMGTTGNAARKLAERLDIVKRSSPYGCRIGEALSRPCRTRK